MVLNDGHEAETKHPQVAYGLIKNATAQDLKKCDFASSFRIHSPSGSDMMA